MYIISKPLRLMCVVGINGVVVCLCVRVCLLFFSYNSFLLCTVVLYVLLSDYSCTHTHTHTHTHFFCCCIHSLAVQATKHTQTCYVHCICTCSWVCLSVLSDTTRSSRGLLIYHWKAGLDHLSSAWITESCRPPQQWLLLHLSKTMAIIIVLLILCVVIFLM